MLFNPNDITLSNYEEYFILYMDNELDAAGRQIVEAFISLHPHLADELDTLMSTRLPVDDIVFYNKEELLSSSMKVNAVDEGLLLYVDNEVSAAQKILVEEKISSNKDYALQYSLLMQTKADASEIISYPNKKELYRHTEKVVYFPVWMRVAVAVVIFLFASFFFLVTSRKEAVDAPLVANQPPVTQPVKKKGMTVLKSLPVENKTVKNISDDLVLQKEDDVPPIKREIIKLDAGRLPIQSISNEVTVNKIIAQGPVTSPLTASYTKQNDPTVAAVLDGDFEMEKKTRGKGFFRKVSRFIQRNTGIGTVNSDNELLIGAVALKLK